MRVRSLLRRSVRRGAVEPAAAPATGPARPSDPAPASEPLDTPVATAPPPDPAAAVADRIRGARDRAKSGDITITTAVAELSAANRAEPDPRLAAEILALRHAAVATLDRGTGPEQWPPLVEDLFPTTTGCPEVTGGELTAELLTSAVLHHGCLLVRGLVDPAAAQLMVETIDRAFDACDNPRNAPDGTRDRSWYRPFEPMKPYPAPAKGHRGWVRSAGGVLAADSPPAFVTMVEMFEKAGLREVISGYLGEQPVLSVDKCTLRRVPLDLGGAEWHQDGSFLGEGIRTLNVWLALSPCGGDEPSPGLDLVPRRFEEVLATGTDGAYFDWSVGPELVARTAVETPVIRPHFEAGDALLFDHLFLHKTALEPTMDTERYAIESWFFASSRYPGTSVPILF